MLFVFLLMWLETKQRGKAKFSGNDTPFKPMQKFSLSKPKTIAACAACAIPFLFGFLIPVAQLISWSFQTAGQVVNTEFLRLVLNSFMLALIASSLCVAVALFVVYAARLNQSVLTQGLSRFAVLGYSIPGAVIAVGVLIPFNKIDQSIDRFMTTNFDISTGLILTGTLLAVTFAYLVRFLAISFNPIKAGFENMGTNLNEASLSLGTTPLKTLKKINLPLVKGALLAAAILVFVDVLKELPVTLILRPFNFDTLAIRAFELASDELVAQSANAALIIILTSVLPVIALSNLMSRGSKWKTLS
jgi:iron(III) transport system permease protein